MDADQPNEAPELSPAARYGLVGAAFVIALLGLTTLDVNGTPVPARRDPAKERTPECIVASAVHVGATPALVR
ncbi:MAG TPA: hypothetical protein VF169_26790 [Albitalea sp.]|uniref:hypothetical protein n=1 Tax=Piscinibacter sp. TaxID=1903157 RepID=UPI002ED5DFF4